MALKMLRFSVSNIYIRSFMGCDFNSRFTPIPRFQHSERGAIIKVGSPKAAVNKSEKRQAIQFERLIQDDIIVDKFQERMKEIIENMKKKDDNTNSIKMEDLINIMMKAAKDVCGTSQKSIFKCNKCNDVFSHVGTLTKHQSAKCTGLISLDSDKKRCDKCLKDIRKTNFASHYIKCRGIKEKKLPRVNCPDCGKEIRKDHLTKHQQEHCKGRKGWQEKLVNCDKCGEFFRPSNIDNHMKSCTGYKADDPINRKCDKCLKEVSYGYFARHYRSCKGIKSDKVNCPDCGKELGKRSLNHHRLKHCHGKPKRPEDEVSKESDQLSDIIVKGAENAFIIKDKSWFNFTEEETQSLRSRVTRLIKVTLSIPNYKISNREVCSGCGMEMDKSNLRQHQKLHCKGRPIKF